jgi:D-alanyl-D-alanine dipeptidase
LQVKPDVRLYGIRPEMVVALMVAQKLYREHNNDLVVTSVMEGQHQFGSLHYTGCAVDLRLPNVTHPQVLVAELADRLGADFDAVLEDTHVHVEFQPKVRY